MIFFVKQTVDDHTKIVLLETTFRDFTLVWYMKFKSTAPMVVRRMFV